MSQHSWIRICCWIHHWRPPIACDVASSVFKVIISNLTINAAVNIVELFIQTFFDLQITPISRLWSCDMTVWPIKAIHGRYLSSRLLVTAGHWDPTQNSIWLSRAHRFHILQTIMGFRPTWVAILRYDKRNPGRIQFDLYQNQATGKHFFFLQKASQQMFTTKQRSNTICVWIIFCKANHFHITESSSNKWYK